MVYSQWILRRWVKTLDSLSCKWRKLLVTQNMCLVKLKVIVKKLGKNWNNCLNCFSNFYVKLKYVNFISIFHVKYFSWFITNWKISGKVNCYCDLTRKISKIFLDFFHVSKRTLGPRNEESSLHWVSKCILKANLEARPILTKLQKSSAFCYSFGSTDSQELELREDNVQCWRDTFRRFHWD